MGASKKPSIASKPGELISICNEKKPIPKKVDRLASKRKAVADWQQYCLDSTIEEMARDDKKLSTLEAKIQKRKL